MTQHKLILLFFCFFIALSFASTAVADTTQEITYLLNYVEKTDCLYDRNGTVHNGVEARKHIQKKYDYFKNKIKTTEDFIAYAATKSTMSGKKYKIRCPGMKPVNSEKWLHDALADYRKNH